MAKILNIIINPSPILRKKSKEIKPQTINSRGLQELCVDMAKTMISKDGIGLAAPQIGKNIRLIAINTKDGPIIMINPKITKKSWAKEWGEEGCLSLPGIFGKVKRSKKIQCCYLDTKNKLINTESSGLMARVIQHEVDHLDGILFIDKARGLKKIKN